MIQISINTIEEGNRFLKKYIKSQLFAKEPESDINAHRPLVIDMDLKNILCRKEEKRSLSLWKYTTKTKSIN